MKRWVLVVVMLTMLAGCGGQPAPTAPLAQQAGTSPPADTATAGPEGSPAATDTLPPTDTPEPTDTPAPTNTPAPTDAPIPTHTPPPTDTPRPTATPAYEVRPVAAAPLPPLPDIFPKIDRQPAPLDFGRGPITKLPARGEPSQNPIDLRSYDLSRIDLRDSLDEMMLSMFDDATRWPEDTMPEGFDPDTIMELGINPGLGVRALHEKGITGRGVGIAILDQTLLVDHQEYAGQLRLYEEINYAPDSPAAMHGGAVASIAVGQTAGVAPEADLYFLAVLFADAGPDGYEMNYEYLAQGIHRVLEINDLLPEGRKIRAISIARGWTPGEKGYEAVTAAVKEAEAAGMLVVYSSMDAARNHEFAFNGLGRDPLADPDSFESYEAGAWWNNRLTKAWTHRLQLPMDSRAVASPTAPDEYVFYRHGGWSWSIPYLAASYALALQVDPALTPDAFLDLAMETGRTIDWDTGARIVELGPILEPAALIAALQNG